MPPLENHTISSFVYQNAERKSIRIWSGVRDGAND